jgi:hypothetical protein
MTSLLIVGGVLAVGMFLVIHGTIFKTRWGINLTPRIECPRCHAARGTVRIPRNRSQALWGGGICERCGLEVDKWNRPISQSPANRT